MNLFFELCRAPIVGVTGSNGKSTTAAMIHDILRAAGRSCWLGGNIGRSLLEQVEEIRPDDLVVLELSSFQLEHLDELRRSPHVAVITNLTPNHLDRHPTVSDYRSAKQAILRHQVPTDFAILNADDPDVRTWPSRGGTLYFAMEDHGRDGSFLDGNYVVVRRDDREAEFLWTDVLQVPGTHNQANALAAVCCAAALGGEIAGMRGALAAFRTLPHRIELVGVVDGRRFYDDSIATTPESTLAALEALSGPIWLIAGGYDKGLDLNRAARRIAERVEGVALLGQTAGTLATLIVGHASPANQPQMRHCSSMQEAVAWCFDESRPGDAVVLSPACASFGMFQNYVERAEVFCRAARSLQCRLRRAG
jgi:UDP-N-acetylmuramoylalanine--D-glutamate ligase